MFTSKIITVNKIKFIIIYSNEMSNYAVILSFKQIERKQSETSGLRY